jgi:hypothetical protein
LISISCKFIIPLSPPLGKGEIKIPLVPPLEKGEVLVLPFSKGELEGISLSDLVYLDHNRQHPTNNLLSLLVWNKKVNINW